MGKAKRTRIPQRMSQHIMQLKIALFIVASAGITYQDDMFIAHRSFFVNTFLSVGLLFFFLLPDNAWQTEKAGGLAIKSPGVSFVDHVRQAQSTLMNNASSAA